MLEDGREQIYITLKWLKLIARKEKLHLATLIKAIDLYIYYLDNHSCKEYRAAGLVCLAISIKWYEPNDGIDYEWNMVEVRKILNKRYSVNYLKRLELHILDCIDWNVRAFKDTYTIYFFSMWNIYRYLKSDKNKNKNFDNREWESWRISINKLLLEINMNIDLVFYNPKIKAISCIVKIIKIWEFIINHFNLKRENIRDIKKIKKRLNGKYQIYPILINY